MTTKKERKATTPIDDRTESLSVVTEVLHRLALIQEMPRPSVTARECVPYQSTTVEIQLAIRLILQI
jgi:hypothetical protein